ncbi:MAG: NAD(P)-binding protein [Myxococcales bacterium]|nr:NAD(P)-binding protein [Myxococcales bacterium]
MASRRQRVAVLGGGLGALSAVFALTETPGWKRRYDITVYQLGWRLGGKATSGRNQGVYQRSEAHGAQTWLRCYENAFALVRRCYEELGRTPGTPMATWRELFQPVPRVQLEDTGKRLGPSYVLPSRPGFPGDGALPLSVWDCVRHLLHWILTTIPRMHLQHHSHASLVLRWSKQARGELRDSLRAARAKRISPFEIKTRDTTLDAIEFDAMLLDAIAIHGERPPFAEHPRCQAWAAPLLTIARHDIALLEDDRKRVREAHLLPLLRLALATARGLLEDEVYRAPSGFDALDELDLRTWLKRHGAREPELEHPAIRALYDLFFAYERGERERPSLAAGAALRVALRSLLGGRGAIAYQLRAGAGEALFAPLYQVLKRRGVRFRFFHKVKRLRPSEDRARVAEIVLGRQVELSGGTRDYDPLITVKGLPCWPSAPRYEQIVLGDEPAIRAIDFESPESPEVEELTLRAGVDFDRVILGISLGALPSVARGLVEASPRWRAMIEGVATVATQGVTLWLGPERAKLLRHVPAAPATVGLGYPDPLARWDDASDNVSQETWPQGKWPKTCLHLSGVMPELFLESVRQLDDHGQALASERVRSRALTWLHLHASRLSPGAVDKRGKPRWETLVDPQERAGEHRFDGQHWWANITGSSRYVQTQPGAAAHRLAPGDSGFDNLALAGDWTRSGLGLGCVETAAVSGLQAARALEGRPGEILGERDLVTAPAADDATETSDAARPLSRQKRRPRRRARAPAAGARLSRI